MGFQKRWRRVLTGTTVAWAALGLATGSASAALSLDNTTDTSITIDGDVHWFAQGVEPQTHGSYQYLAYWDAQSPGLFDSAGLKITRRTISNGTLEHITLTNPFWLDDPNDGHNQLTMGLSPADGRIHVSWSTHNDEHQYAQSSAGCMTLATFSRCTWTYSNVTVNRSLEDDDITYPRYFNDRDGNLYLSFRHGSSLNGNQHLQSYDDDGTWTEIGRVLHGGWSGGDDPGTYDPDGAGPIAATTQRGVYTMGFDFDRKNRLHMMWTWREASSDGDPYWSQRGVFYAYSDDYGRTWKNSAGTTVGTAGADAITVDSPGIQVLDYDYGWMMLPSDIAIDSHNQPHAVVVASDVQATEVGDANTRHLHVWRTTDGTWHEDWVTPSGSSSQAYELGTVTFDRGDTAYYIYNRNKLGWTPWNQSSAYQRHLRWDHFSWQGDDYLHIEQMSDVTAIFTSDRVGVPISTSGTNQIRVRMRNNTEGDDVAFYWSTDASRTMDSAKSQTFSNAITTNDGSTWKTYTFRITDSDWRGTLRELEFNPIVGTSAEAGDEIDIDWIRLTDSSGNVVKAWEFDEGSEIVAAEASPAGNWADWTVEPLLPGVSAVFGDAYFHVDRQLYAAGYRDDREFSFPVQVQGSPFTESLTLRRFDVLDDTTSKYYGFDVDAQGWTTNGDVSGFGWDSDGGAGSIGGTITGNESRIYSPSDLFVRIDCDVVHVRLKNSSAATTARVWFVTEDDPVFDLTKSKTFSITPNSGYTEYTINMGGVSGWDDGEILQRLRIDPSEDAGVRSGSFLIHRVYIAPR